MKRNIQNIYQGRYIDRQSKGFSITIEVRGSKYFHGRVAPLKQQLEIPSSLLELVRQEDSILCLRSNRAILPHTLTKKAAIAIPTIQDGECYWRIVRLQFFPEEGIVNTLRDVGDNHILTRSREERNQQLKAALRS